MDHSTASVIAKIYAVIAWIFALLSLLVVLSELAITSLGIGVLSLDETTAIMLERMGAALAIVALVFAVIYAVVGYGLWTAKPWARILMIVLSALIILQGLFTLIVAPPLAIIVLVVFGFSAWFFGFDEGCKEIFEGVKPVPAAKPARKTAGKAVKKR